MQHDIIWRFAWGNDNEMHDWFIYIMSFIYFPSFQIKDNLWFSLLFPFSFRILFGYETYNYLLKRIFAIYEHIYKRTKKHWPHQEHWHIAFHFIKLIFVWEKLSTINPPFLQSPFLCLGLFWFMRYICLYVINTF